MSDNEVVVWNGHEYFLTKLIAGANDGPLIDLDVSRIDKEGELPIMKDGKVIQVSDIIVVEHMNAYVLFGDLMKLPESGSVKARLLTKPRLKRARDEKISQADVQRYYARLQEGKARKRTKHYKS